MRVQSERLSALTWCVLRDPFEIESVELEIEPIVRASQTGLNSLMRTLEVNVVALSAGCGTRCCRRILQPAQAPVRAFLRTHVRIPLMWFRVNFERDRKHYLLLSIAAALAPYDSFRWMQCIPLQYRYRNVLVCRHGNKT